MRNNFVQHTLYEVIRASGCTTVQLSEQVFGRQLPIEKNEFGDNVALIVFSADQKYETQKGVPLLGDPVICGPKGISKVNDSDARKDQLTVKANEEIAVTVVIQWFNSYWKETCWPFVAFAPEVGAKYIVVNERIGGKGIAALWTGVAFQTCVSTFCKPSELSL